MKEEIVEISLLKFDKVVADEIIVSSQFFHYLTTVKAAISNGFHGFLPPILVDGDYRVVSGLRRFLANKVMKRKKVKIIKNNHEGFDEGIFLNDR